MIKLDKLIDKINYYMVYVMILCPPVFFFLTDFLPRICRFKLPFKPNEIFYILLPIQIVIYIYFLVRKKMKISIYMLLIVMYLYMVLFIGEKV